MPNSEGLVLDADTLGTDKASVRQHYLANNELVGRVNTLGDMRKAMAKQLPPNFDIQERALRQLGIDPVQFSQNVSAFADFISEISDSDFIYYVPEEYAGEYHYIRSILIPFSDEQTALQQKG